LQTIYGTKDLYNLIEIAAIDGANQNAAMKKPKED
jgi:hypothetical protein